MAIISSKKISGDSDSPSPRVLPDESSPTLLEPQAISEEIENPQQETKIRPHRLADYSGQGELKEVLEIAMGAAKSRQEPLDHLLLYGPPGLGKTTLSLILAQEMGVKCQITTAPALEKPRDIVGLLVPLKKGDILFIDEIHRLSKMTEEILYPAMEDFRLDITIGQGKSAKIRQIPLQHFTLIGATTKVGALSSPLRDRFGLIQRLHFYEIPELSQIIQRTAKILETPLTSEGAEEIARRSRGTPRIANRLFKRVRDYSEVKKLTPITAEIAAQALELFKVDPLGLDWTDRKLLSVIMETFKGRPVGLETLAAATGEDRQTIEEVYEPYLIQIGFLERTHRGRILSPLAYEYLGYPTPEKQLSLDLGVSTNPRI